MNDNDATAIGKLSRRPPWNKGKLIGAKPPLSQGHVWSISITTVSDGEIRDCSCFLCQEN
jgi:hypothetical protein